MNIHEHQAKKILKKYGATVPEGVFSFDVKDLIEKAKILKTDKPSIGLVILQKTGLMKIVFPEILSLIHI